MNKFKVVSLFSGCGGLDLPFEDEIYEFLGVYDNDPAAVKCFNYNFNSKATVLDVQTDSFDCELSKISSCDVILGGFPCQGFSKSGPKRFDDPRNQLYLSMKKAVHHLKPQIFIAENVDGIAQNFKGKFIDSIISDFQKIGYSVKSKLFNALNFGVPQYRRRIIFIGIRCDLNEELFQWPEQTHKGDSRNGEFKVDYDFNDLPLFSDFRPIALKEPLSIKDAISDLLKDNENVLDHVYDEKLTKKHLPIIEKISEGQKLCNVRFSDTSVYTWQIPNFFGEVNTREIRILETIAKNRRKKIYGDIPNGNPLSIETIEKLLDEEVKKDELNILVKKGYLKLKNNKYDLKGAMFCSGLYKKPLWIEPSPTILTVFNNPRFMCHPLQNRPFTIRECARLQSFPDNFLFLKSGISMQDAYRLIGNAVPPKMAQALENSLRNFLLRVTNNEVSSTAA